MSMKDHLPRASKNYPRVDLSKFYTGAGKYNDVRKLVSIFKFSPSLQLFTQECVWTVCAFKFVAVLK